ncbi:MAG: hypothetical protein IJ555_08610 [Ruminococcus sp.]|nr:hypothetical protein [Ruminococcus sp.]
MDKLKLNVPYLERKPSSFGTNTCVVEKALPVTHSRFEELKRNPMQYCKEVEYNLAFMYGGENELHCLLIYDEEQGDGLIVESEGYGYLRYAQFVPQAKLIWEQFAQTQAHEMRFCCPLEITQYNEDQPDGYEILDNHQMAEYAGVINAEIRANDLPEEYERGLMHWYHPDGENDEVDKKVLSAHCSVEVIEGELTGVITAKVIGELSDDDMSKFIRYCSGQLSDGWGESLEQKYLKIGGSEINVSFWNDSDDWRLLPEKEYLDSLTQCEDMEMGGLS